MPTLWLFDIEPHEQRYTSEWKTYLPKQIRTAMKRRYGKKWRLKIISGGKTSGLVTPGAFMNFAETNVYKCDQIKKFAKQVMKGAVCKGDRILFADAWHPGVIQCRYMADLIPLKISIEVLWHAGSYDKFDLLGQKRRTQFWGKEFERSVFHAASRNYFATEFHLKMFFKSARPKIRNTARVVGWPMEYLKVALQNHIVKPKSNIILFPHRLSPEKQVGLLEPLKKILPQYKFVVAQQTPLLKADYRNLVGQAVAIISFSKQETLGIGVFEGMLCGAVPIVPKRLSYKELYPTYCYPSEWSYSLKHLEQNKHDFAAHITNQIKNKDALIFADWRKSIAKTYFNGSALYARILR